MKIKTSEATGVVLDWLVAKCEGVKLEKIMNLIIWSSSNWEMYSTDWTQGGPIIEREKIKISPLHNQGDWWAEHAVTKSITKGSTPLIAAMRCYVAFKLGDEVEVPDELIVGGF